MGKYFSLFSLSLLLASSLSADEPIELSVVEKKIGVLGKEATIYAIEQPNGELGVRAKKGQAFDVVLKNELNVPTSIHWHGLILPNKDDGIAFITQFPIYPGLSYHYDFPTKQAGTFWMHSHFSLQEQNLLAAPLILTGADDAALADQEVVVMLADFSFTQPEKIFENLKRTGKPMPNGKADLADVKYDAFLTNYRTLESPQVVTVQEGKRVRLRLINSASSTNFFINLGNVKANAIAVDGNRILPYSNSQFELAVAQRIDLIVEIPKEGGYFPVLAIGEGSDMQTGLILTTKGATPPAIASKLPQAAGAFTNKQESDLHALTPLAKKDPDNKIAVELGGDMATYTWTINGQAWPEVTPLVVEKGQRVEITFTNKTSMSHPMHLHGHVFQVTALNGTAINGALRDTVLIMPHSSVTIQFDADNPGVWPLHCHILYHQEAGMFTVVRYKDFVQPL